MNRGRRHRQLKLKTPLLPKEARNKAPSTRRKKKNFLDDLSNSGRPFDYIVKAGPPARPRSLQEKTVTGEWRNHGAVFGCDSPPRRLRPVRRGRSDVQR